MKTKVLNRMLRRLIKDTRGRFIAITLIIMLGVLMFVGVKGIGPGYRDSATTELTRTHLEDLTVTSTAGLTAKDIARAEKVAGVTVQVDKNVFALAKSDESVVTVYGYQNNHGLNRIMLKSGHLPRRAGEIVLDARAIEYGDYRLGDTYHFKTGAALKQTAYKIVGFANSPLYINNTYDRGNANIGSGTVAYFAYVQQVNIKQSVATQIALRLNTRPSGDTYSKNYRRVVQAKLKVVKRAFAGRAAERQKELLSQALAPITKQQQQLDKAKEQLAAAKQQVSAKSAGRVSTTPELTAQDTKLAATQTKLDAAKARVGAAVKMPTYSYGDRSDLSGFDDYGSSADRIAAIGDVFPVFFFLIAALITFTTVSRMISEDRTQLGTMTALGYSRIDVTRNYFLYAFFAAIVGTGLGIVIGQQGLVRFVLQISQMNIFSVQVINPQWLDIGLATALALLATIGAVTVVAPAELKIKPAALMLPKAPKNGQKILLERLTPLWRRLSFHNKVSLRNLFRFKSRMFMTIIGIAGGAGLILTGFGIRDSITGTTTAQFGGVVRYQAIVRLADDKKPAQTLHLLEQNASYEQGRTALTDTVKLTAAGKNVQDVSLIVPAKTQDFAQYVRLKQPSGQQAKLAQRGAILTTKAAQLLAVHPGDWLTAKDNANHTRRVQVTAVVQNYTGHFLYMSSAAYRHAFGHAATANSILVKTKAMSKAAERKLAKKLLQDGDAVNTTYMSDSLSSIHDMGKSLNAVVLILILLSGLLSFVVLYNLTNINVSERMRELSTIKVLGFYDGEVTLYIVRENIVLTLIGILCSFGVGQLLTRFILNQAATATILFPNIIGVSGYIAATVLTIVFTMIVMVVTHVRLKHVDMLAALAARE